ncbi:MAG: hypothetical protein E7544_00870 [Ruminococcaceae bacterium]|nr:hypothetical protein [Oscillospiraceae bacterium]
MKKQSIFTAVISILVSAIIILAVIGDVSVNLNGYVGTANTGSATQATVAPQPTAAPQTTVPAVQTTAPAADSSATETTPSADSANPTDTKAIIEQYTLLVNKFKQEKPAFKKKEFQSLPEEFRNLGTAGNLVLEIAAGYMTTEEECEEIVRAAGSEEIKWDMPIHNSEVGCLLTDYDAVAWAKCEDVGDGTKKISFSLKEEMNAEPTPADTLVPVSKHGAVMQPLSRNDITAEVEKITSKIPGLGINDFSLGYRDCEFSCIYNPETNQVLSITHHVVIDINADIQLFVANIAGSARLYNDMLIYDITW